MTRITPIRAAELPAGVWKTSTTIRFGQCDPAGIVYTPVFFDMFNVVVEQWYSASLGLDYYAAIRDQKLGLGYGHVSADFLVPCTMGDVIDIAVLVDRIGRASFTLTLHVLKQEREAVRGRLVVVTTSLVEHKAAAIPGDLRTALERYQAECA
jgi:4-hydroxybenzoyl-CoA thioesterase/acyl-CoA thioester hydrolase